MANQMTAREQRFAALLLETTKVDAYKQAGYSQKGSQITQTVEAYRLSKRPKVQREVARLLRQRAFPADDYKRLQETAIAGLTEIFLYDADSRVRLKVGAMLLKYAEAGLKLHPEPSVKGLADDSSASAIVAELRAIYAQAGITMPEEDVGRNHRDQALILEPVEEEGEPLVEAAVEAESAGGEVEAPEAGERGRMEVAAENLNPSVEYRWEPIPGYFPTKYRRVRIQP